MTQQIKNVLGSGCGSVGRAVPSDTKNPRFESCHQQTFIKHLFTVNCVEKTKIKKKRQGEVQFFINYVSTDLPRNKDIEKLCETILRSIQLFEKRNCQVRVSWTTEGEYFVLISLYRLISEEQVALLCFVRIWWDREIVFKRAREWGCECVCEREREKVRDKFRGKSID